MSPDLEHLKRLPISERMQLVEDLWSSIASELEAMPLPESLQKEMERRLAEHRENPSRSKSLDEVQQRMKEQRGFGERRA